MTTNVKQFFDEDFPRQLAQHHDAATQFGAKFQLCIPTLGEWYIDVSPSGPSCQAGNHQQNADVTITIDTEDFNKIMENPEDNARYLFFAGKLKVTGNQMLGLKLGKLLLIGRD